MRHSMREVVLTSHGLEPSIPLVVVIVLATLGTGVLFAGSVLAWRQRRETRYVLITLAVGALFVRSLVGFGTVYEHVPMSIHHFVAHSLDVSIAALVLYAVYRSKPGAADPAGDH